MKSIFADSPHTAKVFRCGLFNWKVRVTNQEFPLLSTTSLHMFRWTAIRKARKALSGPKPDRLVARTDSAGRLVEIYPCSVDGGKVAGLSQFLTTRRTAQSPGGQKLNPAGVAAIPVVTDSTPPPPP